MRGLAGRETYPGEQREGDGQFHTLREEGHGHTQSFKCHSEANRWGAEGQAGGQQDAEQRMLVASTGLERWRSSSAEPAAFGGGLHGGRGGEGNGEHKDGTYIFNSSQWVDSDTTF